MTRLNQPVNVNVTGDNSTTGEAILTVGSSPLPGENNVTVILFGASITVQEDCLVQIKSNNVVLYEKRFTGTVIDNVSGIVRKGAPTHGMKIYVSGCGEDNQTTVVADVGFEFNGGAIATGG